MQQTQNDASYQDLLTFRTNSLHEILYRRSSLSPRKTKALFLSM